jgi:tellurite resistance protein
MSQPLFPPHRHDLEEQYFRRIEQELIEKLRRRAEEAARLQRLSEHAGVADPEILNDLRALGYTPETLMLLYLAPLVHVAWADGEVSTRERQLILDTARARGVEQEPDAWRLLDRWLTVRPSQTAIEKTMHVIAALLQARSPQDREATRQDLLSYCTAIAEASGGILGFGRVSPEEQRLLTEIASELQRSHDSAARSTLVRLAQDC